MYSQPISPKDKLHDWLLNFIRLFRTEYEKLSDREKQLISIIDNYNPPLQVEVFWLKQPEFQLFVFSHFEDRKDMEILVHEPLGGSEFVNNVESVLKEERWNRTYKIDSHFFEDEEQKYADILAYEIHRLINNARHTITHSYNRPTPFGGSPLGNAGWIAHYFGNISEIDYRDRVKEVISQVRQMASYITPETQTHERPKWIKSYATFVFPPIVIGKKPEPTIQDKILGLNPSFRGDELVLETQFGDVRVIVNKDGFIGVGTDDKKRVLEILNTIMTTLTIEGISAVAVRENELSETNLNPDGYYFSGYTIPTSTLRGYLFEERWGPTVLRYHQRKEVEPEKIKEVIEKAKRIFETGKISSDLIFLLESYTHYENAEYSQSFMMSWIIIEHEVKNFSKKESLKELKKRRNDFIHGGKPISKEDAEKCFTITNGIVMKRVDSILSKN